MKQRLDESLIEKAADRLGQFPGLSACYSRRDSLRMMAQGLIAGVMAPSAATLIGATSARAAEQDGPSHGGREGPHEELLVCYYSGLGTIGDDLRYITLNMTAYDLDGNAIGAQHGVQETTSPAALFNTPPAPPPPFDAPPVPLLPVSDWTKGIWSFADGSAVYAAGPAIAHVVQMNDGSWMFMVTTGQTIVGGLGRYANAYGVKQATGTAFVPSELVQSGQFPAPGVQFFAKTIEAFRIFVPASR
jgi:hypothetical protein